MQVLFFEISSVIQYSSLKHTFGVFPRATDCLAIAHLSLCAAARDTCSASQQHPAHLENRETCSRHSSTLRLLSPGSWRRLQRACLDRSQPAWRGANFTCQHLGCCLNSAKLVQLWPIGFALGLCQASIHPCEQRRRRWCWAGSLAVGFQGVLGALPVAKPAARIHCS